MVLAACPVWLSHCAPAPSPSLQTCMCCQRGQLLGMCVYVCQLAGMRVASPVAHAEDKVMVIPQTRLRSQVACLQQQLSNN